MIALYADAEIFGGVQILVIRFSQYLKQLNVPFVVIATKGTRVSKALEWADQVDPHDLQFYPKTIDYVLFPHVCILKEDLYWEKFKNAKILCWLVHPTEIFSSFFPVTNKLLYLFGYPVSWLVKKILRHHNSLVLQLLQELVSKGGLILMDGATRRGLKYFFPELIGDCNLIPIPAPCDEEIESGKRKANTFSIGYLGRLDEFKYSALKPFIENQLSQLTKRSAVHLHLISEGHLIETVVDLCAKHSIRLTNYGFLPNEVAKKTLKEQTDVAASMGTAALDIASTGHPSIIIDPALNFRCGPQKKFRFVHEIEDFTLGEFRDFSKYQEGLHTLEELVDMLTLDQNLGFKNRQYVEKKHNPKIVFSLLLTEIYNSQVIGNDISDLAKSVHNSFASIDKSVRGLFRK
jgi:hypothetical protein